MKGLLNSPNVGLANITETFSSLAFQRALLNTVKLNLLSLAITMVLAFLLAISIDRLDGLFQKIFLALILIHLFIPGSVLVHICFVWFKGTACRIVPCIQKAHNRVGAFLLCQVKIRHSEKQRMLYKKSLQCRV